MNNYRNTKVAMLIPARYASSRYSGKLLAVIHGKSLISRFGHFISDFQR